MCVMRSIDAILKHVESLIESHEESHEESYEESHEECLIKLIFDVR